MKVVTESKQSEEYPRESEAEFRLLFEKSPDAMLLLDGDVFVDCNQAAVEMMGCASKKQLLALHPYDISPEKQPDGRPSVEKARELIDMAHQKGSLRFEWVHRRMDGREFTAEVLLTAIPLRGGQVLHVVLRDITERVRAEQALRESEAHFRSLLENATNFAVYRIAVDPANPYGGRVVMVSPSIKEITGISDPYRFESWFENLHPEDLPRAVEANRRAVELGEPYSQPVRVYHPQKEQWVWVHTASTPVFDAEGRLTYFNGLIMDITEQKRAEEALQLAYQTLEQRVEERTRELQTLLDVVAAASSSLELDEMLSATLDRLVALVGAARAGVMLLDPASGELEPRMLRPEQPIAPEDLAEIIAASRAVIAGGEPLYVPVNPEKGFLEPGALLPLRARGQALGMLAIIGPEGETFSRGQLALFESIADQLGVAVENARLYEQAEQAAAAAERSRLARDLHDAVTQTLFSAGLIAEVLPRIWEQDPEEGRRRLEELRELTRGALAEMRALLLELRPSALAEAKLGDLLRQLAESITGRVRVPVTLTVEGECTMPPEVKVAFYRIAQEALSNIARHAGASQASVNLRCQPEEAKLCIRDDGRGFDPRSVPPESLGLGIMRERAEAVGAALTVESEVGRGTEVVVKWRASNVKRVA